MHRKYLWLFIILLLLWIIFGSRCCKSCYVNSGGTGNAVIGAVNSNSDLPRTAGLKIMDKNFSSSCNSQFNFVTNTTNYLDTNLNICLRPTAEYLKNNGNRKMIITGEYYGNEKKSGLFENMGLARANAVKNALIAFGAPANQFDIASKLRSSSGPDSLMNAISFGFDENVKNDTRLIDIKTRLQGKPLTIYFATNQNEVVFDSIQQRNLMDIIYYLDRVPSAKINVGGYTDNVGNTAANIALSTRRADFVKDYLIKNGMNSKYLNKAVGNGPEKPIATNDTAKGRALNRRVEIILN